MIKIKGEKTANKLFAVVVHRKMICVPLSIFHFRHKFETKLSHVFPICKCLTFLLFNEWIIELMEQRIFILHPYTFLMLAVCTPKDDISFPNDSEYNSCTHSLNIDTILTLTCSWYVSEFELKFGTKMHLQIKQTICPVQSTSKTCYSTIRLWNKQ